LRPIGSSQFAVRKGKMETIWLLKAAEISWQLAVGSWQLAVGKRKNNNFAKNKMPNFNFRFRT
jgi:hypothetical protein